MNAQFNQDAHLLWMKIALGVLCVVWSASAIESGVQMHPPVDWQDSSMERACGKCHDMEYIAQHNSHGKLAERDWSTKMARLHLQAGFQREADCFSCHTKDLKRPTAKECMECHGTCIDDGRLGNPELNGLFFRSTKVSETALNLRNKNSLNRPMDVHAERGLQCSDCHFSLNHPAYYQESKSTKPKHLIFDGRKTAIKDYLHKPDHHLATGKNFAGASEHSGRMDCDACHTDVHQGPWRGQSRVHFEKMSCQACHIPTTYGPMLEMVDWTKLDSTLTPYKKWRNHPSQGISSGFEPLLLKRRTSKESRYPHGFAYYPFNPVTTRLWVYGDSAQAIPVEKVHQVSVQAGSDSMQLSQALQGLGFAQARIQAEVTAFPVSHGVGPSSWATRRCESCHSPTGLLDRSLELSTQGPMPILKADHGVQWEGELEQDSLGVITYKAPNHPQGVHILGSDNASVLDILGMLMLAGVVGGAMTHGGLRAFFAWRRRRSGEVRVVHERKKTYMYTVYERFWHWLQAFAVMVLLLSGVHIRFPDLLPFMSFVQAVHLHNIMGVLLAINAGLSLFYHLAGGEIRQFLPEPKGFFSQAIAQQIFYLKGIFRGEPHPFEKVPEKKLNPLQQLAYLGLLNILLPLQIFTGLLMWQNDRLASVLNSLGGLAFVTGVHALAAWAFAAFLFMHIYLTTTGDKPTDYMKAMVTGWEEHS